MTSHVADWRQRAGAVFQCEKRPAYGAGGMVVTNHPVASAVAAEILLGGGNAFDAMNAAMFTLTVVEPMMVGVLGGGMALIQHADGTRRVLDGNCVAPGQARPELYRPDPLDPQNTYRAADKANDVGVLAVATPGTLPAWVEMQARWGKLSLSDVIEPAIRYAERGFRVTPYLSSCIADAAEDLARDAAISAWLLPDGTARKAGELLTNPAYAAALSLIARDGVGAVHGGPLGAALVDRLARDGGILTLDDLTAYRTVDREPLLSSYRDWEVISVPPPSAAGPHILQMLRILEGYDLRGMGFGTIATNHLLAEVLKIAFADRETMTGDPAFAPVSVDKLLSESLAQERRAAFDPERAQTWESAEPAQGGTHTTHATIADAEGNVISSTQSISSTFGARLLVPETGMMPNNYMAVFDLQPGGRQSLLPGKRVTTSMGPSMISKEGKLRFALGLPGGKRIFPSIVQTIVNIVDHGMPFQEAMEAPRVFTEGGMLEMEDAFPERTLRALRMKGHPVQLVPHIAGGMNGIEFLEDGNLCGAGCWRADGTALAVGGGLARADVRFWPDAPRT